ncbi:SH3 domain-binding protein 2 isoform X2 [Alosa sapidissima]|uniref:SH3 domain-binding protein 2 isoform X2 n=1 Tax=Alosa sapidissima TaxID=34773 RepID=UPI001C08662B|nr:SH3 domain-binding protein 2 isoform X2 [Alosa sapidissima]
MALSVKKKRFVGSSHPSVKMCLDRYKNMSAPQLSWPVPMRAIGAQNLLTMPGGVTTSGYLHKKGGSQFSLMKWPLRYIIIHKGCVYYFKTSTSATPQGAFSLSGYNRVMRAAEETTSSNVFPFKVVHFSKRHRTWYFSAASEDERRKWMCHLRREIDHYNDRRDTCVPSDSDSDAESFYGPIECPLDITHTAENPEGDYLLEEDSDEEDYLKPDGPSPTSGRPIAPPPSYPPPPVPYHPHPNSLSAFSKGPPPTPPPIPKKPPPSYPVPTPCSLPPSFPPPMPHAPTPPVPKPAALRGPPLPSLDSLKKQISTRTASTMPLVESRDRKPSPSEFAPAPATLPFVKKPPPFAPPNRPPPPSVSNHALLHKPPPPMPPNLGAKPPSQPPTTSPNFSLVKPKLTPPKPPLPGQAMLTPRGPSLQSSPDGQSFRSLGDEMPSVVKKLAKLKRGAEDDSDDDYENVQLPDSVFVETTETSIVERMFKDWCGSCPQDGLYCFRKSGTKTSKVLVVWDVSLIKARNYRLFEEDSKFFLETDCTFTSLAELVEYYHGHPLPNHGSLCLQKPYGYTPPR